MTHLDQIRAFLEPREWGCVAVIASLIDGQDIRVPTGGRQRLYVHSDATRRLTGLVLHNAGGIFYPVLCGPVPHAGSLRRLLGGALRRVYSVVGIERDVDAFDVVVGATRRESVGYHLMVSETGPETARDPRIPPLLRVRRATPADAGLLFPIQKGYELEEVLLDGNTFNARASMQHLRLTLATQRVTLGQIGGQAVAKAGTNARGIAYEQIGGVYTAPDYRNRGIATLLMRHLLADVLGAGKHASLFVKRNNGPALTMYQKLGFAVRDGFRITYYR